jgi:mannose-6-phosphate isomerase-like protein (cupin superfamily)
VSVREPVNVAAKFDRIDEFWSPRIIGEVDEHYVKIARVKGEFVWHAHDDEDELFFVVSGRLTIRLRDGEVVLNEGDLFVVPKSVEHQPFAEDEAHVMVLERKTTHHTGGQRTEMTVERQEWV